MSVSSARRETLRLFATKRSKETFVAVRSPSALLGELPSTA